MTDIRPPSPAPTLLSLEFSDITEALAEGWRDFRAAPQYGLFFGGVFAFGGLAILGLLNAYRQPWMIIPIAIAFPLIGPFVAAGLYEISRRLRAGEPLSWRAVLGFMARQSRREFSWMAFIVLFIFWMWMYQVRILMALMLDSRAFSSPDGLLSHILTTADGWIFLLVGTVIGSVLALILFSVTAIAMPLLVDREHDIVTAIVTSVRTVVLNPGPMLLWGIVITGVTIAAMLPLFLGLLVVFPVLGHATWHVYRRAVAPLDTVATGV